MEGLGQAVSKGKEYRESPVRVQVVSSLTRMGRVAWGMCTHQSYVNQAFTGNQSINS